MPEAALLYSHSTDKHETLCVQVREVPLGEFRTRFSGDVNAVLMDSINQRLLAARVSLISYHPFNQAKHNQLGSSRSRPS